MELIRAFIKKESKGFEYGMGKSTIFFGRESDFIHSVSTSETWVEEMEKRIEKYNIKHVKLHFTPVKTTKIETIESFYPPQVRIPSYRSGICRKYWAFIQSIDRFNDESLDFVFIQDKARIECLIKSRNKVRSGGMIIFKDSDKKRYSSIMQIMRDWQKVDTFSGFSKTTIWIKP
ncbi:MAG: hypothetical protein LAT68_10820 [Cyclobacteriaceae bacterium]|nr:hypothetical protein [Cyclobacteriaceae bacterium]